MCLGLPGQVVSRAPGSDLADVDVAGVVRPINMALLDVDCAPGSWILIHSGFALEPMTPAEAADAMSVLTRLGSQEVLDARPSDADAPR